MQLSPQSNPIPLVLRYKFSPEILTGSLWTGASNKGGVEKTSYFLALCVDISKTVRNTTKVTTNDWWAVAYVLTIVAKVNDLGWPWTAIRSNFLGILRYFAFLGEQMFVVDGVTVKNASEGDHSELYMSYMPKLSRAYFCVSYMYILARLSRIVLLCTERKAGSFHIMVSRPLSPYLSWMKFWVSRPLCVAQL